MNGWVCSDQNPPSAVPIINSMLGITLVGDMHGYFYKGGDWGYGDFAIVLPTTNTRCTVRIRGIAATYGYIVSNGKKIFKYDNYGSL